MLIFIGKFIYLFIWSVFIYNLVLPFPSPANVITNIGLITFIITHGLQAYFLHVTMTRQEKKEDRYRVWRLFLFGVFESLSWKTKN